MNHFQLQHNPNSRAKVEGWYMKEGLWCGFWCAVQKLLVYSYSNFSFPQHIGRGTHSHKVLPRNEPAAYSKTNGGFILVQAEVEHFLLILILGPRMFSCKQCSSITSNQGDPECEDSSRVLTKSSSGTAAIPRFC